MPKFKVMRAVDAFALYEAVVEAADEIDAARIARENDSHIPWTDAGLTTFDARGFVTLAEDGKPIGITRVGDF